MIRDLARERREAGERADADARRRADKMRSLRIIKWLGLLPFLVILAMVIGSSAYMRGYRDAVEVTSTPVNRSVTTRPYK